MREDRRTMMVWRVFKNFRRQGMTPGEAAQATARLNFKQLCREYWAIVERESKEDDA